MQHEKTINRPIISNEHIGQIEISACGTFHMLNNEPLYKERFLKVGKFHKPGLAPVYDESGAYHINIVGKAAYNKRFKNTFGFYCDMATVQDSGGFYHIKPDGRQVYDDKLFDWAGNYQENLCVVKKDGYFFHIDNNGNNIYNEQYNYVGDFKDKIAVVHQNGKATHINDKGKQIHNKWFKDLGIFHKGFAIAEDESGWFHINVQGTPAYPNRFKNVEPYYNELAKIETFDGVLQQIDIQDNVVCILGYPDKYFTTHQISSQLAGFWYTYLISTAVELDIFKLLPSNTLKLSSKLNIPEKNLKRLLKSLWEIGITQYDKEKSLWHLSYRGEFVKQSDFLAAAATMWVEVARQEGWNKLVDTLRMPKISSFPSFKGQESSMAKQELFYKALIGYSKFDTKDFSNLMNINQSNKIILFGAHSLGLIENIQTNYNQHFTFYNSPKLPTSLEKKYHNILFKKSEELEDNYDLAILFRFLSHYDDNELVQYLNTIKQLQVKRLLIIETLVHDQLPLGGIIDINIMVESGGKLRSADEWQLLLNNIGYKIKNISSINSYLSVIDAQY